MRPIVFSTVPFSQLWKGAQKNVLAPTAAVILSCSVFSGPLSSVTVFRRGGGYFFSCRTMAFIALLEVLRLSLVIRTKRLFLSVVTWSAARLCLETTASPSQWPITFLVVADGPTRMRFRNPSHDLFRRPAFLYHFHYVFLCRLIF